ncbi:MAG: PhzF family phenazine biosynthesis protein [Solirubrobacterales bacterium]|nr:PhzF family phenazine biosynthesis protein [Solirubrobacterales bacterium]
MLRTLRVFCAADASGGNELGVFLDGAEVPDAERQAVAHDLGYSETVFVDDVERAELRIFTPEVELALAGHPLVGTAWLLRETGTVPELLRPPAGEVSVRFADELSFVAADPEWAPRFDFVEVDSPAKVDELDGAPEGYGNVGVWAWLDQDAGAIRERVFVPEEGIPEDEATGAAALRLVAELGREIEIHQGRGSVIRACPLDDGRVEIGGATVLDEVRSYRAPAGR